MNIDKKCMCDCKCETVVTVSKCQSRGKIWCKTCWPEHATPEERAPHPAFKNIDVRRADGPGLIDSPIVSVKPMPKGWLSKHTQKESGS